MLEETFWVLRTRNELLSIFDRLYLMTHVLAGDRKGVIFLSFASSFI